MFVDSKIVEERRYFLELGEREIQVILAYLGNSHFTEDEIFFRRKGEEGHKITEVFKDGEDFAKTVDSLFFMLFDESNKNDGDTYIKEEELSYNGD